MMKMIQYDVHVCDLRAGHSYSEDCWCEPCKNYWIQGVNGKLLHVLEHNDTTGTRHNQVLDERDGTPDWITQRLDGVGKD